jgi:hypothetical protein
MHTITASRYVCNERDQVLWHVTPCRLDVHQHAVRSSKIWVFCNIVTKTSDLTQCLWQNRQVSVPRYECRSSCKESRCSVESSCRMWTAVQWMAGDKEGNVTITEWKASNCFEISPHSTLKRTSRLKAVNRCHVDQLSWFCWNGAEVYGEKIGATVFKSSLNTGVTDQTVSDPVVWGEGAHKVPKKLYALSHAFELYIQNNHNHNHNHIHNLCPCFLQFDFSTLITCH